MFDGDTAFSTYWFFSKFYPPRCLGFLYGVKTKFLSYLYFMVFYEVLLIILDGFYGLSLQALRGL